VKAADDAASSREADRRGEHMNEATDLDAEYGGRTAAPSQLHAAADDIGRIGSGRDVQQQARDDEAKVRECRA
jgi:hypothetical protein